MNISKLNEINPNDYKESSYKINEDTQSKDDAHAYEIYENAGTNESLLRELNSAVSDLGKREVEHADAPQIINLLSAVDIEKIDEICKNAEQQYFSKSQPGYRGTQVYVNNQMQNFCQLNRDDQMKVLKSAHTKWNADELQRLQNLSQAEFDKEMSEKIRSKTGRISTIHGVEHAVGAALMAQVLCTEYLNKFSAFANMSSRVCLCSIVAALLHDIGRTLAGDSLDISGATSAHIAENILTKVGGFSKTEIGWIKNAIENGGFSKHKIDPTYKKEVQSGKRTLSENLMIACIMGDADRYEFERFKSKKCNISYLSPNELGLATKNGDTPDNTLNSLKNGENKILRIVKSTKSHYNSTKNFSLYRCASGAAFRAGLFN